MTAHATADIDFDPFAPRPFEELPPIWDELRDRAPMYRTAAWTGLISTSTLCSVTRTCFFTASSRFH